ncbi:MAG: UDP-N-acetylmuramate dehydrogenase [Candidatus Levybacteria bacterium]|nr:UDP-N-acetylmuramate dehydrogenase [Candidatus Levybacteria bacterium]
MNFQKNILLKNYSNYKIGGPAKYFIEVTSAEELKEVFRQAPFDAVQGKQDKIAILGGGTNILISDQGFDGLVIHNKIGGIERSEDNVIAGSGVLIKELLDFCIENSLSGLEWAGGLPGTLGGAVRGNAGAFKGETKDNIVEVKSLGLKNNSAMQNEKIRNKKECKFSYRDSIFKSGEASVEFIISVTLNLRPGDKEEIRKSIQQKIDYRNLKHPMNYPNIGSIFKNIPLDSLQKQLQEKFLPYVKTDPFLVVPTTKLLALSGLKGRRCKGAMISDKHPNFIVNVDSASEKDIRALIKIAKETIRKRYGIPLEEEIIYLPR